MIKMNFPAKSHRVSKEKFNPNAASYGELNSADFAISHLTFIVICVICEICGLKSPVAPVGIVVLYSFHTKIEEKPNCSDSIQLLSKTTWALYSAGPYPSNGNGM